ncbi:hypothetical protein [Morganella phage phiA020]
MKPCVAELKEILSDSSNELTKYFRKNLERLIEELEVANEKEGTRCPY